MKLIIIIGIVFVVGLVFLFLMEHLTIKRMEKRTEESANTIKKDEKVINTIETKVESVETKISGFNSRFEHDEDMLLMEQKALLKLIDQLNEKGVVNKQELIDILLRESK